jgi:tetratricopeptide (TPR) repeat protein
MHLKKEVEDVETYMILLQSHTEKLQFDVVSKKADSLIQLFPTQPEFYYYSGLANNQLTNYKIARDVLESGLDFVVDDIALEINFNIQLGEAFNGLGDVKKKEKFFTKANELIKNKK